jgi:methyl CpG binding protein 2
VSQRKSGASAGRYEVFIIGPSGKRFRSRNELKTFFEKTGETGLNPDDFDFSTFGRNNPKVILLLVGFTIK